MSYSTKKRENKNLLKKKNSHSFEFNSEIQNDIGVIRSFTSRISKINEDEGCSIESSEKVQEIVQEGKLKIQEIQKKLKNYSSNADNIPQHEKMRKKLMLQKLSKSYLDAVNSFQKASKNYINKTVLNSVSEKHLETPNNVQYDDEFTNFLRKGNSNYDSSKDRLNVNIYDYNFYENDDNDGSGNANRNGYFSGNISGNLSGNLSGNHSGRNDVDEPHYGDYRNVEKEGLQNSVGNKKKRKKYKSSIFTGNKKNDVNEYLLQNNDFMENEKEEYYEEKQFISIKTVDIENEILNQKNKEIKKLHKDIINIQDIYKELFDQINIQGETIDNIDSQIVSTHDNIVLSGREIQVTRNRYFRNIRCIGYLFIALFILFIIILVVFKII